MANNIIPLDSAVPQNLTSERSAISCLCQNFSLLDKMTWPEDLFLHQQHKVILQTIKEIHEEGSKQDIFALESRLESKGMLDAAGGPHGLFEVSQLMPTGDPGIAAWHREELIQAARYRKAMKLAADAADQFRRQEGDIASVSLKLSEASAMGERNRQSTKDIIIDLVNELERNEPVECFPSSIPALDDLATLKRGELLTVAAPTSGGKSIMLIQLAVEALKAGKHVAFFSMEMPAKQVVARMLSYIAGFQIKDLRAHFANKAKMDRFRQAVSELNSFPLTIESGYSDMEEIDASARELHSKGKADLIVVDYVQVIYLRSLSKNETREQHVSEISKRLKALALQLNIAVASASQLNDEGRLRESRAIAHHSDHVWLVRHDNGSVVIINKNREGETGAAIPITMVGAISAFIPRQT